jgi:hypothetical protein
LVFLDFDESASYFFSAAKNNSAISFVPRDLLNNFWARFGIGCAAPRLGVIKQKCIARRLRKAKGKSDGNDTHGWKIRLDEGR